jgi:hypothetical protein
MKTMHHGRGEFAHRRAADDSAQTILKAIVALVVATTACAAPPAAPEQTAQAANSSLPPQLRVVCEISALDGERLVPPVNTLTVRVGQTITFSGRLSGSPLTPPPYTYRWTTSQIGLIGQQTTNETQNAIQHVFETPIVALGVGVQVTAGNSVDNHSCRVDVLSRAGL